jgi:DNA-binding CsgD family transcriptional regulator
MDQLSDHRLRLPLVALLLAIAAAGLIDLGLDRPERWVSFHTVYEAGVVVATAVTAAWLWNGWRRAEGDSASLRRSVARHQAERDAWRGSAERALAGFGAAIDQQFSAWKLTPAEREVALHLLKGRSHKEIASQTGRSERTIRQHAAAAYDKAGLDGRAALAAFFLEGVRLPPEPGAQNP